ncbi:hypothetical protein BGZ65_009313, partial [Modicella reniformis]
MIKLEFPFMTYERKRDWEAAEWEPPNEDAQQELAPEQVPELPHEQEPELPHEQEPELPHEQAPEIPHEQAPGIAPEEEEELVRKFDRLSEYLELFKGTFPAATCFQCLNRHRSPLSGIPESVPGNNAMLDKEEPKLGNK